MFIKNKKCEMDSIIKIFFVLSLICSDSLIFNYIKNIYNEAQLRWKNNSIDLLSIKNEILSYKNLSNISLSTFNLENIEQTSAPKISLIIPIYYYQENLINFYMSVYNQSLKDLEIIFINYISEGNSTQIIETLMQTDKRIIYIDNEKLIHEFLPKKKGILTAKGEYILIIEPDDLLLNNILEKLYLTAKNNNIDILQYYIMVGTYKNNRLWKNIKCNDGIINYPKIEKFFFECRYFNLLDKLIKREIFIESLNDMTNIYDSDEFNEISDDDLAFFTLSKKARSYGFFEDIGYFYNLPSSSATAHFNFLNMNYNNRWSDMFYKLFRTMKFFYEKTKNNRKEKEWVFKFFYNKIYNYRSKLIYIDKYYNYFNETLEEFLRCDLFNKGEKNKILKFKNMLNAIKNRLEF